MEQNWLALSQCNSYYHQKLQLKDCRRSLQNIILLRSIAEVSTGCANGKSKMKKDEKHKALFDSIGRQADILYKVSHVSSFMSTPSFEVIGKVLYYFPLSSLFTYYAEILCL